MLKKILIALAAIIAVFLIVVALQPSEFHVERTATITAPPATVFDQVNDFHKWDAWSPWAKLDPNAKIDVRRPAVRHRHDHDLGRQQPGGRGENDAHREPPQ